jgi:cation diffusion facilitator CzcD-associated flavoprotein CzcO
MNEATDLLIIGAGPYGLAMAAYARHLGIDHVVVGSPMDFWKTNMPPGMYLRTDSDVQLDPLRVHTIEKFLALQGLTPVDVEPLSLQFYLAYAQWFQEQKQIDVLPALVQRLDCAHGAGVRFRAALANGQTIIARHVVVAVGFKYFKHLPRDLVERLPAGRFEHTCDLVDLRHLQDRRCLIVGGRQSAFEWTALLNDAGCAAVHVSHRHDSPAFNRPDMSWIAPMVEAIVDDPGCFRRLPQNERDAVIDRFWAVGRLNIEPWLRSRVMKETVTLWPRTSVGAVDEIHDALSVQLDNGSTFPVDAIILATGYRVQIDRVPFLARGNVLSKLVTHNGFPKLDEHFQTSIPGLFITSIPATQDFGPFFGFTFGVGASAKLIGRAIASRQNSAT